ASASDRTPFLVVTFVETQPLTGERRCVASVVGVVEARPEGLERPTLTSRPYGTLSGCGRVMDGAEVTKAENDPIAQDALFTAMVEGLGHKLYTRVITIPASDEPPADQGKP